MFVVIVCKYCSRLCFRSCKCLGVSAVCQTSFQYFLNFLIFRAVSTKQVSRFVQDSVHSSYNRAWKGQERRTLREHIHITESKGGIGSFNQKPQYTMNPIKLFGGNRG